MVAKMAKTSFLLTAQELKGIRTIWKHPKRMLLLHTKHQMVNNAFLTLLDFNDIEEAQMELH